MSTTAAWMSWLITLSTTLSTTMIGVVLYRGAHASGKARESRATARLAIAFLAAWLVLVVILGASGFFVPNGKQDVPRVLFALLPLVVGLGAFAISPAFRDAVDGVPPQWLIGVQVNRLLGGVFLIGYAQGLLPAAFALPAGIGDVLIGLTAPLVAVLVARGHPSARRLAVPWNLVGMADLVLAVTLGILTAPGSLQRLALDTPNTRISDFPFVLVPVVLVPLWMLVHVFSLRGLARQSARSSS